MTNAPTPAGMAEPVNWPELKHAGYRVERVQGTFGWAGPCWYTYRVNDPTFPGIQKRSKGAAMRAARDHFSAQPSAGAEPVAWRVIVIEDGIPIGKWSLVEDCAWAREHPSLYRAEPLGVIATHPAPVHAASISREQVLAIVRQFASPSWCSVDRLVDTLLAALTKEAPAATGAGEIGEEYEVAAHCVTLAECPPGLFLFNGSLGFKSEYGAMEPLGSNPTRNEWKVGNRADAYCADSGECFWGGTSNHDDRAKLLVYPIDADVVAMVASHGLSALAALAPFGADPCASHKAEGFHDDPCCPHCPSPVAAEGGEKQDAERFRALMRCGRIKMQGSSGVDPHTGERNGNNVHFGAEFWPEPNEPEWEDTYRAGTTWGRACLKALADAILEQEAALRTEPTGGGEG